MLLGRVVVAGWAAGSVGKLEAGYMILGDKHHHGGRDRSRTGLLRARLLTGVMLAALVAGGSGAASATSLKD
ncbi:MAG TPA: hypothetical protein DCL95_18530, partial [Rhodospirillaceae bacterium]|nr:hypothetical protein [Rhodospirillaceae bacterium]